MPFKKLVNCNYITISCIFTTINSNSNIFLTIYFIADNNLCIVIIVF